MLHKQMVITLEWNDPVAKGCVKRPDLEVQANIRGELHSQWGPRQDQVSTHTPHICMHTHTHTTNTYTTQGLCDGLKQGIKFCSIQGTEYKSAARYLVTRTEAITRDPRTWGIGPRGGARHHTHTRGGLCPPHTPSEGETVGWAELGFQLKRLSYLEKNN